MILGSDSDIGVELVEADQWHKIPSMSSEAYNGLIKHSDIGRIKHLDSGLDAKQIIRTVIKVQESSSTQEFYRRDERDEVGIL